MKSYLRRPAIVAMVILSTFIFSSCFVDPNDEIYPMADMQIRIPVAGGTFTALNENAILTFPEGAVSEPVKLLINTCLDKHDISYPIKMVTIEPLMVFIKPVLLSLKYDGELVNEGTFFGNMNLMAFNWDKKENVNNKELEKQLLCNIDTINETVNLWITQTGVYAIGTY
jgi:hypothetical protein